MAVKTGLVALASTLELGGERSDDILAATANALTGAGLELVVADRIVESTADALTVCDQFKTSGITSLVVVDVTWQGDALKYVFTHELALPTLNWAVPYADTFSMACVQHYASVLRQQGIWSEWVSAAADDPAAIEKAVRVAKAGELIAHLATARVALVGPRNAWRVAGAAEMVTEEWDFSKKFGATIVHVEMEEITDVANSISDAEAAVTLRQLQSRTGTVNASNDTLMWMAKVYTGVKAVIERYRLDVVVGECYPRYAGLLNLPASWLGDEGIVVETEGDIAGAVVMHMLNTLAGDAVATGSVLGETGGFNDAENFLSFAHEGSSPTSYATAASDTIIEQMDDGTQVCFPVRAIDEVTVCSLVGTGGTYKMLIANASTLEASDDEWAAAGRRMLAKVRFTDKPSVVLSTMIDAGIDHHWILKEGDHADVMQTACDYLQVATLRIN